MMKRQIHVDGDTLRMFVPFGKVEQRPDGTAYFEGFATVDEVDKSGEIVDIEASRKAFDEWADEVSKLTDGKSRGNIRAMHEPIAAGRAMSHEERKTASGASGIFITGNVDDVAEAKKAVVGTYGGLSIAGNVKARGTRKVDGEDVPTITAYDLTEVSLVDRPCSPSSVLTMVKRDGTDAPYPTEKAEGEPEASDQVEIPDALRALAEEHGADAVREAAAQLPGAEDAPSEAKPEATDEAEPKAAADTDATMTKADVTSAVAAVLAPLSEAVAKMQSSLAEQADERRGVAEATSKTLSQVTDALAELRKSSESAADRLEAIERQPGPFGRPVTAEKSLAPDVDDGSPPEAAKKMLDWIVAQQGIPQSVKREAGIAYAAAKNAQRRGAN